MCWIVTIPDQLQKAFTCCYNIAKTNLEEKPMLVFSLDIVTSHYFTHLQAMHRDSDSLWRKEIEIN